MAEIGDFDVTDANNIARWPENMRFRDVNDAGRADEGLLARWYKDTNGSLSASGSSNAYSVTANRTLSSYATGLIIAFTANHTNTGAATLNVSGLGAKTITRPDGSTLLAGDITSGQKVMVAYVASTDKLQLLTMPATSATISIRVGSVLAWPTSSIPTGMLLANGQSVAVASYPALFAEYGYTYGGSGANFNVPDYRDYFLRGHSSSGTDASSRTDRGDGTTGANVGTKQEDAFESHNHTVSITDPGHGHSLPFTAIQDGGNNYQIYTGAGSPGANSRSVSQSLPSSTASAAVSGITASSAVNGGTETRPRNITVNWIIVATPAAALATSGIGRNTEAIYANRMTARVTSGAGSATIDSGSNDLTIPVFDFDDTAQEFIHFTWLPPKRWDLGTVTFEVLWTNAGGTPAQTCIFSLAGVAISDDDVLNTTFGTAVQSSDVLLATGDVHRSPESAAITIAGTPAQGDMVIFQLARVPATDTMVGDARVLGLRLFWTSNATSDD